MNYNNRNFWILVFVLIFQEFFWLGLFRFTINDTFALYRVTEINLYGIIILFLCSILVFFSMLLMYRVRAKVPKIRVSHSQFFTLVLLAMLLSVYLSLVQGSSLRYTSGAQTGINGVILIVTRALLTGVALAFITHRNLRYKFAVGSLIVFSSLLQIDGFAMALTFICIIVLIFHNTASVHRQGQFLLRVVRGELLLF